MRLGYAIVFVSDMGRSLAFYRDALGLPLRFESPGWTEFDTGGATLALHTSESAAVSTGATYQSHAGECRPGLAVDDLDAFHARMVARDVPCAQEPRESSGVRMAQYRDPDGLLISVTEARRGQEAKR